MVGSCARVVLLTDWWQLILHFQDNSFPNIFQQADDLVVTEFGQVDSIHCFDVVTHIQLVTSAKQCRYSGHIGHSWFSCFLI